MSRGYYIESDSFNPYKNLATEEWLLELVEKQRMPVLFLWQNDKSKRSLRGRIAREEQI